MWQSEREEMRALRILGWILLSAGIFIMAGIVGIIWLEGLTLKRQIYGLIISAFSVVVGLNLARPRTPR